MADTKHLVKHVSCTEEGYLALGTYNDDTLYFLEDTHKLYKGSVIIANTGGGNVEYTTVVPEPDEMKDGLTYIIVTDDGQVIVYAKNEEGEAEVIASTMSEEDIDNRIKELIEEYANTSECFNDVEAERDDDGNTKLTFTQADGDTKVVTVQSSACTWTYLDEAAKLVYTYQELKDAIEDPDVFGVVLGSSIECTDVYGVCVEDGQEISLDLNGHNLTGLSDYTSGTSAAIIVFDGTLTVKGSGNVDGGGGSASNLAVCANGENAKVIINGGNYTVHKDKDQAGNTTIYGETKGTVVINGGYFDNDAHDDTTGPKRYVLNIKNNGGSKITCYGGEFVDQNPDDGDDKDTATGSTFLGDGCSVQERQENGHTIYKVTKD